MAKDRIYNSTDAAGIKPKLIPDYELMARDDSGGPDYNPYTAQFSDGGFVQGAKAHLSASGGSDDAMEGSEQSDKPRTSGYDKIAGSKPANSANPSSAEKKARM